MDKHPQKRATSSRPDLLNLADCRCCPRACGANRIAGPLGTCGLDAGYHVSSVCVHRGEEPVISGPRGICNVFFKSCNLHCVYCQNYQISRPPSEGEGRGDNPETIVDEITAILDRGIKSVGFVSPSHCLPQMLDLIERLRQRGRRPRYVFNTNAYDRVEIIRDLEPLIDIYLPDLKYMDDELGRALSDAPHYPRFATAAIREMFRQKGAEVAVDDDGDAVSGLIIRHLVLPGQIENSKAVLSWIARELSPSVHVSLMAQYHPTPEVRDYPTLGGCLTRAEYDEVLEEFERLGFHRGWVQELESARHYRPDFELDHPFEP